MSFKFTDINDIPGIIKSLKAVNRKGVEVGILGNAGKDENGTELATIFAANEFGTDKAGRGNKVSIPERSTLRTTFDNKKVQDKVFKSVDRILDKGVKPKQILNIMGSTMVGEVKKKILSNVPPPNAPSTKAQKRGSARTLNNTGIVRKAIDYAIV